MKTPITPKQPGLRLTVIERRGISVYEGRERIALLVSDYPFTAADVEELRTKNYELEEVA